MRRFAIWILLLALLAVGTLYAADYQVLVFAPSEAQVTSAADGKLGYEIQQVELVSGQQSGALKLLVLHNRFPTQARIVSLQADSFGCQLVHFGPTLIPAYGDGLVYASYQCPAEAMGGTFLVSHQLVAEIGSAKVQLSLRVPISILHTVSMFAEPADGGFTTGAGKYAHDSQVTVGARPKACYHFSGWVGDVPVGHENDNPLLVRVQRNLKLKATFAPDQFKLTTMATPGGSVDPPGQTSYACGTFVRVKASPAQGYRFAGWSIDLRGGRNPETILMHADKQIKAIFVPK